MISVKELAKQTDIHDSMVRIIVKRLKIEVQLNEEKLQCITNEEKQRFLEYVKKDYKRKRKTYNCSPELLVELEKDRAERKELLPNYTGLKLKNGLVQIGGPRLKI